MSILSKFNLLLILLLGIFTIDIDAKNLTKENLLQQALELNDKGVDAYAQGNYQAAIDYINESLTIRKKVLNPEDNRIALSLHNLGRLYIKTGQYKKALSCLEHSLNIRKKIDKEGKELAISYNSIGIVYQILGEYPKALEAYTQALNLRKKIYGENDPKTAIVYNSLGMLYEQMEDYAKALEYYKKDLQISTQTLDSESSEMAIIYNNLALLYRKMEDFTNALLYYQKALRIHEDQFGQQHSLTALSYNNIGVVYLKMKKYDEAIQYLTKALTILGRSQHHYLVNIYNNLALSYSKKKEYAAALTYYQKSLEINKNLFPSYHPNIEGSYNNITFTYKKMENYKQAYNYSTLLFDNFINNRDKSFTILDAEQKQNYIKINQNKIDLVLNSANGYLSELNSTAKQQIFNKTFTHWLNYKGTLFEYQNILTMVEHKTKNKTVKKEIKELKNLTKQLNQLEHKPIFDTTTFNEINETKKKITEVEIRLSQKNTKFQELFDLKDINFLQIASKLQDNQLYIDFAKTDTNYYIFTLDKQNHITFNQIDINKTKDIDKNIEAFRANAQEMANTIVNPNLTAEEKEKQQTVLHTQSERILSKLYTLLLDGVIDKQFTKLTVSPDGLLNFLPFEALYHHGKYLVEAYTINYISSGKEFIRQAKREKPQTASNEMVIFADPDFNSTIVAKSKGSKFGNQRPKLIWGALGKGELNMLKGLYPNAIVYTDQNATVDNLMRVNNPKILHLSTHGIVKEEQKDSNPMLQSLLIFAGVNNNQSTGDTQATALQLSTLDLINTELVVLSACESGLGKRQQSEGIYGLPKAFIQAGAKNVIMSLWTVSNNRTTELMKYFYNNVSKGEDYATALRNAKLKMIKQHPYFWSAFIMSGI